MILGKGRVIINTTVFCTFCYAVFNMFATPKQSTNIDVMLFISALLAALLLLLFDWRKLRQKGVEKFPSDGNILNKTEMNSQIKKTIWVYSVFIFFLTCFGIVIYLMDRT